MDDFIENTISNAALKYPIDFKIETQEELNDSIYSFIEAEYNSCPVDIPDDFDFDWVGVINYINDAITCDKLYLEFPLCKITLYNKFIYYILMENQEVLFQAILKNLPNCK